MTIRRELLRPRGGGRLLLYLAVIALLVGATMVVMNPPAQAWCKPGIPGCPGGDDDPPPPHSPSPPPPPPPPTAFTFRSGTNPDFCVDFGNFLILDNPVIQTACNGS